MATIKKSANNKRWRGCGEKGILLHCLWEYKLVQTLWRTVWRFLKKLNIELLYDPAILLLSIVSRENHNSKNICTPIFTATLFTIAKIWKQSKCPSKEEWIKKMWYIYTMEYYSAIKKNTAICSNMDGPKDYHSKCSKRTISYAITNMSNLVKK